VKAVVHELRERTLTAAAVAEDDAHFAGTALEGFVRAAWPPQAQNVMRVLCGRVACASPATTRRPAGKGCIWSYPRST
jgi:hypothetical protein